MKYMGSKNRIAKHILPIMLKDRKEGQYCDPPYENTASYKAVDKFNHQEFWEWCRTKSKEGHTVFISEYNAPSDFECIWEKEISKTNPKQKVNKTEKLFKYNNLL